MNPLTWATQNLRTATGRTKQCRPVTLHQKRRPTKRKKRSRGPFQFSRSGRLQGMHIAVVGQTALTLAGSWKSLFFYLCMNAIQFAPLKSQGAKTQTQRSRDQTAPQEGHSVCSPKTIYALATAVSISSHEYRALPPFPHRSSSSGSKLYRTLRSMTFDQRLPRRMWSQNFSRISPPGMSHCQSKFPLSITSKSEIGNRRSEECNAICCTRSSTMRPPPPKESRSSKASRGGIPRIAPGR